MSHCRPYEGVSLHKAKNDRATPRTSEIWCVGASIQSRGHEVSRPFTPNNKSFCISVVCCFSSGLFFCFIVVVLHHFHYQRVLRRFYIFPTSYFNGKSDSEMLPAVKSNHQSRLDTKHMNKSIYLYTSICLL